MVFSLCMEFLPASSRGFWLVFMEVFWTVKFAGWPATRVFELFYTFHVSWVKMRKQSNLFTSQTVSAWRFSFLKVDRYRLDQLQKHY